MRLIITAAFGVAALGSAGLWAQSGGSGEPQFEVATIRQAPPISVTSNQLVTGGFKIAAGRAVRRARGRFGGQDAN